MKQKVPFYKKDYTAKEILQFLSYNKFWLPFWLIFGMISCAITQYDFLWDLENYHIYNPWYWFDSKGYEIYTPLATINSFFNPLPDVPLYYMIKWFNSYPTFIFALQGLWFGALLFIFHKTALLYFDKQNYRTILLFILTLAIAITGQAVWFQAGSSTNEIQIAFFVMWGEYYILKWEKFPKLQDAKKYFWCGIILGFVLGLKQTSITYSFALGFTMIAFYKNYKNPIKIISMFILGGLIGCLVSYGYFLYRNYIDYGNPIMPFLNTLFQSEYYDNFNFQDRRHIPVNFWEFLYYPYVWEERAAEIEYNDIRGAVYYTLSWGFALYALIYYIVKRRRAPFFNKHLNTFTTVYLLFSYIIWTIFFSIFRYLIPMEMLFAIFFVKTIDVLLFKYYRQWLVIFQLALAQLLLFEFLKVPFNASWGRMHYLRANNFLEMDEIKLPPNTLIKFYNLPIGFIAPMLAKNNPSFKAVAYIDDAFGHSINFTERNKFAEIRDKVVAEHKGPVVIIAVGDIAGQLNKKSDLIHSKKFKGINQLKNIDTRYNIAKAQNYKYILDLYNAGQHRIPVDLESLKELTKISPIESKKYYIDNEDLMKMYCHPLYVNVNDKKFTICVPQNLRKEILPKKKVKYIKNSFW